MLKNDWNDDDDDGDGETRKKNFFFKMGKKGQMLLQKKNVFSKEK